MKIYSNYFTLVLFSASSFIYSSPYFPDNDYHNHYWQAFIEKAKKNNDKAMAIMKAIECNQQLETPAWSNDEHENIDDYFDALFVTFVSDKPESMTYLGIFDQLGIRASNAHLNNLSPEAIRFASQKRIAFLKKINSFSYEALSEQQKISFQICSWLLDTKLQREQFLFHGYRVNQMWGIVQKIITLFTEFHPLRDQLDIELYLNRLTKLPEQLNQTQQLMEYQQKNESCPLALPWKK